jgi:hypothetical protein
LGEDMKISKLIQELEAMKNTFGDISVVVSHKLPCDDGGSMRQEDDINLVTQGEYCVAIWVGESEDK